jgi:hypothetical protein
MQPTQPPDPQTPTTLSKKRPINWTKEEDEILIQKTKEHNYKNWSAVASFIPGRTAIQCSARYKRIQPGLIKGAWTPEEDLELLRLYKYYGKNWSNISRSMPQRTGKQIRDRFLNALDDNLKKEKFSLEEDKKVLKWYKVYGNAWSKIAKKIKGRTGDMVKNRFYSSLKNHIDDINENTKETNDNKFLKKKRKYTKKKKCDCVNNDNKSNNTNEEEENGNKKSNTTKRKTNNNIDKCVNANACNNSSCTNNNKTNYIKSPFDIQTINKTTYIPHYQNTTQPHSPLNDQSSSTHTIITPEHNKYFYTSPHILSSLNVQYQQPPQLIPCVNSSSFTSIEDNTNNNSNFISNKTTTTSSSLQQYREPLLKYDNTHHNSSFQSKSEILKNLLQSQMTNGVRKDNLVKQLEILKELKTITKERINAFSTTTTTAAS